MASYPLSDFGTQMRAFSKSLYEKYDFIEYSVQRDAVFCFQCRIFDSRFGYEEGTFTKNGFRDWKKNDKIKKHRDSSYHLDSGLGSLQQHQEKRHRARADFVPPRKFIQSNRDYIKTLLRVVIHCSTQNISLRERMEYRRQS